MKYGRPIGYHVFAHQYTKGTDNDRKDAVKALTHEIHLNLTTLTVNAPEWHIYLSAHIAKDIAYESLNPILLQDYVTITQR